MLITVKHNIEVAHRLFNLKGRCEQIHGHSMHVEVSLVARLDSEVGVAKNIDGEPLEFGAIKRAFRKHLDTVYDHHLLLNDQDPWAQPVFLVGDTRYTDSTTFRQTHDEKQRLLPGLVSMHGDPTTENIARWISEWSAHEFKTDAITKVKETDVNEAQVFTYYNYLSKSASTDLMYGR